MTALYIVGDVFAKVAELRRRRVRAALVLCSPPFLALRSYLPDGHPLKGSEIGSEATPAAFIDVMLALVAELAHVLEPWGSIAFELGDTFSGSGGAGGDYADDGWRGGQARFGGSAITSRTAPSAWSYADALWLAAVFDTEGYIGVRKQESQRASPNYQTTARVVMMDRQVCDRAAEITGVGHVGRTKRQGAYYWAVSGQQARYVFTNIWPYLLIKQRQAMAAIELQRHIEEKRRRGKYETLRAEDIAYRQMIREFVMGLNARGDQRGVYQPTWSPPTPPRITHPLAGAPSGWPRDKSLCGTPQAFMLSLSYGTNVLTGEPSPAGQWLVRNLKPWIRSNPPVGALGDKERPATSYITVATRDPARYFDLDAVRTGYPTEAGGTTGTHDRAAGERRTGRKLENTGSHPAGAPPRDWWHHVDAVLDACLDDMAGKRNGNPRAAAGTTRSNDQPNAQRGGNWSTLDVADTPSTVGARGVHLRRALERAGILATVDAIDCSPKGYRGAHYAVWPPDLVKLLVLEMCPRRVCITCGQPSRRITSTEQIDTGRTTNGRKGGSVHAGEEGLVQQFTRRTVAAVETLGWSDCGCSGDDRWRPGLVLDPFVGSGTTLQVCTGLGRDSIGIDLDYTNVALAMERVGMWLDVEWPEPDLSLPALGAGSPHRSSYTRWARLTGEVWHVWGSDDEREARSWRLAGDDVAPLPAPKLPKRRQVPAVAGQAGLF